MPNHLSIGIFEGKQAPYNQAILEALLRYGPLTSWEIAKKIYAARGETKNSDIAYSRTQRIYSVIARKEGRLDSLKQKGYIMQKDSKYEIAFPKGLTILIKKPDILNELNEYYLRKPRLDKHTFSRQKNFRMPFGIRLQIDPKQLQTAGENLLNKLDNREFFRQMAKSMQTLVEREYIDLDRVETTRLAFLILQNMKDFFSEWTQAT